MLQVHVCKLLKGEDCTRCLFKLAKTIRNGLNKSTKGNKIPLVRVIRNDAQTKKLDIFSHHATDSKHFSHIFLVCFKAVRSR